MENPNNIFDQVKARKVNVPDTDYFSQLADSIIEQKDSKAKVIPMYKKPLVWMTSAAAVIAVLIVFNYEGTSDPSINLKLALSEISTDEIVAYMDEHVDDFDTDLIAEAVPVENIYTNSYLEEATMPDAIISFETISDNEIMEYLLEEGIDLDELSKI